MSVLSPVTAVRTIVAQVLELQESDLPGDTELRALGIDSVMILRIVTRIEQRHGIELSEDVVFKVVTLEDLETLVRESVARKALPGGWRA